MIVVDTSALISVVLNEPAAPIILKVIEQESASLLISAGTMTEIMIVSAGRGRKLEMETLLQELDYTVVSLDEAAARRVGEAYTRWGRGFHSAGLNFGDCFAYALAIEHDCPLLFVGNDFVKTDVLSAIPIASVSG